jgi:hypothetical protein
MWGVDEDGMPGVRDLTEWLIADVFMTSRCHLELRGKSLVARRELQLQTTKT